MGVADAMSHPATLESRINIVVLRLALSAMSYLSSSMIMSEQAGCGCFVELIDAILILTEEGSYGALFETGILIVRKLVTKHMTNTSAHHTSLKMKQWPLLLS